MTAPRLVVIVGLTFVLLAAPLAAGAQPAGESPRIGFLAARGRVPLDETLWQGLRELGYIEGKSLLVERRYADGKLERLPNLAAELVRLKVDLIIAIATPATQVAKQATGTIPIVMVGVGDPVASGIVASLGRPGGNVTGLALTAGLEIVGKRLELLKQAVPKATRVAVVWDPTNPAETLAVQQMQAPAQALGLTLHSLAVREFREFEGAFAVMSRERDDALVVTDGQLAQTHRNHIVRLAAKHRMPAIYGFGEFVDTGGLMSYAVNRGHLFQRAAIYVDKIFRGAKPTDLPVEQPTRFELVINSKTADVLGLRIPPSLLAQADDVVQ